jgi:nucleotide-binding universal stress UspA family protein
LSEADPATAVPRIVVAFDTTPVGEAALEAALGLAEILHAEIAGLFVEDVGLVRMAALPFTRELGLTSAALRPIESADIERALKLQAAQSRAWLEATAAALNVPWSFQVVRGESVNAALEFTRESALLVMGSASAGVVGRSIRLVERAGARPSATARGTFHHLRARPITMLFDGSERSLRALAAAHTLASRAASRLTLLVVAENAEDYDRRRQQARSWLAEQGGTAKFVWLKSRDAKSVAQAAGAEHASALVWHEETAAPPDPRALRRLLAEMGCPLILVS